MRRSWTIGELKGALPAMAEAAGGRYLARNEGDFRDWQVTDVLVKGQNGQLLSWV